MKAFNFAEDVVSTEVTVTDGFGDGGVGILNGTFYNCINYQQHKKNIIIIYNIIPKIIYQ